MSIKLRTLTPEEEKREEEMAAWREYKSEEPEGKWAMPCQTCHTRTDKYISWMTPKRTCRDKCDQGWVLVDAIRPFAPCKCEDHEWIIEFDCGTFNIRPRNPHSPIEQEAMRRYAIAHDLWPMPGCDPDPEFLHDGLAGELPVKVKFVDDSTPDTWMGPAEYGYYFEFEVIERKENDRSK